MREAGFCLHVYTLSDATLYIMTGNSIDNNRNRCCRTWYFYLFTWPALLQLCNMYSSPTLCPRRCSSILKKSQNLSSNYKKIKKPFLKILKISKPFLEIIKITITVFSWNWYGIVPNHATWISRFSPGTPPFILSSLFRGMECPNWFS